MDTKKLRQKILDLAIRGKLVPQDPNDEPASVLLERIRAEKQQLIKEGKIKAPKGSKTCDTSHYEKIEGPFEIPESWEWVRLDEIGNIVTGSTPPKNQKEYYGGQVPFYKPADLEQGFNTISSADSLTDAGYKEARQLPKNSVLVTCIGATIGKTGIIRKSGSCNQQINAIIHHYSINPEYIYFQCVSDYFQETVKSSASATTLPILNKNSFANLIIPIPPRQEQDRIVQAIQFWSNYVDGIEVNAEKIRAEIDIAKSKILSLAISGKLVPQDPSDEPAIELLKRINPDFKPCDNSHYPFEIPENWELCHLGELFNHNTGKALNASNKDGVLMRYITTSNLYWDRFELSEVREMFFIESEIDKCQVIKGDLLVCEGGDVGRSAIWPYDDSIMIQNHIHKLRPKGVINVRFYLYTLMVYKQIGLIGGKGIGILGLSSRELDKLIIPVPPIEEQHRITEYVDGLFSRISHILENIN